MNRQMTVSQLSRYIKGVFEDEELLHDITLSGEVAEVSYSERHTFLVLSDGAFSVRCVHFSSRDKIEKGAFIALRGSVNFYDKRNSVTFTYSEFFSQGVGDKNTKLMQLKQKLCDQGYFTDRPQLPKYIVRVVAVTSPDGAAIRDFIRVVHDENQFVVIEVYPVKVQGEGAAARMADAIAKLQSYNTDAIVLCRGGGSDEDLDAFNDEQLAVAVATSRIPIISAVGHEVDYTLCDYCAGTRAGTPSIAGQVVNAHAGRIVADLATYMSAIKSCMESKYQRNVLRLNRLGKATTYAATKRISRQYGLLRSTAIELRHSASNRLQSFAASTADYAARMKSALAVRYMASRAKTDKLTALLSALDPHRIIKVGYAAVAKRGKRISGAAGLDLGDDIDLIFSDGTATAHITAVKRNAKE
ncbi:MAG: exodeoxyribonuclease VII large subunit [Clostridiales bacterium]|nr:exodeoxyribonuclease VII large subunit [Clostridiales bacterium]